MANDSGSRDRGSGIFGKLFCNHHWVKREAWHQQGRANRKIAFKCSYCGKVVNKERSQL